ncbi:MAG: pyruvate kinase [Oscillospiraceae bacterium]|nr:pyruvate kinase [Oscillospiraceae bacterium]
MTTDIYGTLGPACADVETLEKMFAAGMSDIRLNLSHVTLRRAADQVEALHKAAAKCGIKAKLLIDMQGPELRLPTFDIEPELIEGETVVLGEGGIPMPEIVLPWLVPGQQVLLDDGRLLLEMLDTRRAKVVRGGLLKSRKSIALPGSKIHPPTMTTEDLQNIADARAFGVTGVMQPFVRDAEDLKAVRAALDAAGAEDIALFAKIENMDGVEHLEELLPWSDEIVIARGDLGNAMPLWELPAVQKRISEKCRKAGKNFMVVTQMLWSMEKSPVPTRAEVSDIFNAVYDGCSSVMVTGETAVGKYPVEVIKYLANTAKEAEKFR